MPSGVASRRTRRVDVERDASGGERRLERRSYALEGRADERDALGLEPAAQELEHLVGDELERGAVAGALEPADRALERRRGGRLGVGEEPPLEVGERRVRHLGVARAVPLDAAAGERGEVLGDAAERRERGPAGLVGQRDGHLGAARERGEQPPLGRGQVLEAVGEHRPPVPGVEVASRAG